MVIKINDLEWEIKVVSATDATLVVDGDKCRGTTWFGKQQIFLSSELDYRTAKLVILHELTHAFLWSTQMRIPEKFNEEEICDFMACWGNQIVDVAEMAYAELYIEAKHGCG